jgi:hypothetical protein
LRKADENRPVDVFSETRNMTPIPIETKNGDCGLCKTNGSLSAHDTDVDIDICADCAHYLVLAEDALQKAGLVRCVAGF